MIVYRIRKKIENKKVSIRYIQLMLNDYRKEITGNYLIDSVIINLLHIRRRWGLQYESRYVIAFSKIN